MDSIGATAPPVVGVVVVHQPGPWFEEVLRSLAHQDYPNLNTLFLVGGDAADIPQRIKAVLPNAFVRGVPANPGFGAAANEALRLVEGSGFFCVMHDDVALATNAVSELIEEMYRSNAGIVGPKLVDWDHPEVLQHVGLGVDRFGEVDPLVENGELDQEQHDAVRDVFAVPSACLLIRADLFRTLGGFPIGYEFHGDDLDLCWRTHLNGARVLVVPSAVARHRERLVERRPDLSHRRAAARHRIDTVATLTGRWRTPVVLAQLAVVSIVETVVGLFTGRSREGLASLYALLGLPARLVGVFARRREVRPLRAVPEREVARLQVRGSARLASFLRHRRSLAGPRVTATAAARRTSMARVSLGVWGAVLLAFVFGSRSLISNGVGRIGQFVELPRSADLFRHYVTGWQAQGFAHPGHPTTALALLGIADVTPLPAGLTRLMLILGPILIGFWGAWRLAGFLPSAKARAAGLAVYAAIPLPYAAVSAGRWGVLAAYGAFPWAMDLVRRASGVGVATASHEWGEDDIADAVVAVSGRQRVRMLATLGLLCGVVGAFVPVFPLLVLGGSVLFAFGTGIARGSATLLAGVATAAGAVLIAAILNIPWITTYARSGGWTALLSGGTTGSRGLGVVRVASFGVGSTAVGVATLGLYVALVAAPLIGRGWRLTWASRAACLALGFGLVAVLADRGSLPVSAPELGLLLVPVACGLALGAACAVAAFEHDVRGARLGWRQPLGLVIGIALIVGLVPGIGASFQGDWSMPSLGLSTFLRQLRGPTDAAGGPTDVAGGTAATGDYRVLFIGHPDVLPVPGRDLYPGVAYAVVDDGPITVEQSWPQAEAAGDRVAREAIRAVATVSTARAGRLLGTLGVRYVVVPINDGIDHSVVRTDVPAGLLDALSAQLDLRRVSSPDQLVIFENTSWLPVRSVLDTVAAARSKEGGVAALVTSPLGSGVPVMSGIDPARSSSSPVAAGTLNLAFADPAAWDVTVAGQKITGRASFGWSSAYDTPGGDARISPRPFSGRKLLLVVQAALWAMIGLLAVGGAGALRRRRPTLIGEPVLDFSELTAGPLPNAAPNQLPSPLSNTPTSPIADSSRADPPGNGVAVGADGPGRRDGNQS